MAILKNVQMYWVKCDPDRPNAKMDKDKPQWEVQIRTKDKNQAAEWKANHIKVTLVEGDDGVYYRANLKKKAKKKDGTPNTAPEFVNGKREYVDPNTVGNGSIGNIRIFSYEYPSAAGPKMTSMLMGVQVTTLNEYVPKKRDDEWDEVETVVNKAGGMQDNSDEDDAVPGGGDDPAF
jgi:hypothetical protein